MRRGRSRCRPRSPLRAATSPGKRMHEHAGASGIPGVCASAPRSPAIDAGQHVAHAGRRHAGIAAIADRRAVRRRCRPACRRPSAPRRRRSAPQARERAKPIALHRRGVEPSRRAASPGCGVRIQSSRLRAAIRASRFSASASMTSGRSLASTVSNIARAHSSRPRPGPIAMTSARSISGMQLRLRCSTPRHISSGRARRWRATFSVRVATVTSPAPLRRPPRRPSARHPPCRRRRR